MTSAEAIYRGSDGAETSAYYKHLEGRGPIGIVAMNLFRAQKCSSRAKVYRGRRFKDAAYERKEYSLRELCRVMKHHGPQSGIWYGWREDPSQDFARWVLYVELPEGQVSFHAPARGLGPDHDRDWDREHKSEERIIAFCDRVASIPPHFPHPVSGLDASMPPPAVRPIPDVKLKQGSDKKWIVLINGRPEFQRFDDHRGAMKHVDRVLAEALA